MSVLQQFYADTPGWNTLTPSQWAAVATQNQADAMSGDNMSGNVMPWFTPPEEVFRRLGYTGQYSIPGVIDPQSTNDSQGSNTLNPELMRWLESRGYKIGVQDGGGTAQIFDSTGRPVSGASWTAGNGDDRAFWNAALLAGGLIGSQAYQFGQGTSGFNFGGAGATATPATPAGTAGTASTVGTTGAAGTAGATGAGSTGLGFETASLMGPNQTYFGTVGSGAGGGASSFFSNPNTWRSMFDIASGIYGMRLADKAREASDPFAPYRPAYAAQLQQLEANPSLITQRPGWSAGISAINASSGATGMFGSGNEKAALARWGGDFYNAELSRLAGLAGAGATPGAGQFNAAMLDSSALASIAYGFGRFIPQNTRKEG